MQKNKSFIKPFFLGLICVATCVLCYVIMLEEVKTLSNEKKNKSELLTQKLNELEVKKVELQKLTSEARIVKIAEERLGFVQPEKPFRVLEVSKEEILLLEKKVNNKYD